MTEETLFELALHTPPAELPALLDRECANNAALRLRIEKLLAAHLTSDGSLAPLPEHAFSHLPVQAGSSFVHSPAATAVVGSMLGGKYKLIELIGDGGMGSVYMAQQTEPVNAWSPSRLLRLAWTAAPYWLVSMPNVKR